MLFPYVAKGRKKEYTPDFPRNEHTRLSTWRGHEGVAAQHGHAPRAHSHPLRARVYKKCSAFLPIRPQAAEGP